MPATKSGKKGKSTKTKKPTAQEIREQEKAKKQLWAIVLFAAGILLFFITLISGQNVWRWFHNLILGMFGWSAYLISPLFIYVALMSAADKPVGLVGHKVWQILVLVCLLSGATQIFGEGIPPVDGIIKKVSYLFSEGVKLNSGGAVSALTGLPLLHGFGAMGAKITILLLIFVFIMIITGATLYDLYRSAQKPVKKMEEVYTAHVETKSQQTERRRFNIDIPVAETVIPDHLTDEAKESVSDKKEEAKHEEPIAPCASSFQKAQEQRDQYLQEQQQSPSDAVEDLLPESEKKAKAAKEKKNDPLIDALINRAIQTPDTATPEEAFLKTLWEQESKIKEVEHDAFVQPVTDLSDGLETINRFQEQLGNSMDDAQAEEEPPLNEVQAPIPGVPVKEAASFQFDEIPVEAQDEPAVQPQEELSPQEAEEEPEEEYTPPPIDILNEVPQVVDSNLQDELRANAEKLVDTLRSFGVQTRIIDIARGPAVTRYELQPSAGVKISKITNLADDIALNLAASGVRIEAPIPNKPAVGIEVPNKVVSTVSIREVLESEEFKTSKSKLSVALGRDIAGKVTIADLAKMPHTLIAGSTGSGKSVCINSLIVSILYKAKPDEVKLLMVDPKMVELGIYNGIPHLLVPVVTDPKKAAGALAWAVNEMLNRYQMFKDNNVRDLAGFNHMAPGKGLKTMPQIVIIIDELADLMMAAPGEVEDSIFRLAQMARAAGMYLVIATQRPSVDVITGVIKANIPSRIAFAVSSQVDSRTILDTAGAEKLLGRGDMLFNPVGASKPMRVQGCFVTDGEVERIVSFIKESMHKMTYDEKIIEEIERQAVAEKKKGKDSAKDGGGFCDEDEMLPSAIECVVETGQASTSLLQRRLKLGYARAARIMDMMEEKGIIGPFEGSKPRQVLISKERWIEMKMIAVQKAEDDRRNY